MSNYVIVEVFPLEHRLGFLLPFDIIFFLCIQFSHVGLVA